MTESRNTPMLLDASGHDAEGRIFTVTPEGVELMLCVEHGQELDNDCTLRLQPSSGADPERLEEVLLPAVLNTNLGKFNPEHAVSWVSADWGAERPLASIMVKLKKDALVKARIKVFAGGVWLPLMPTELLDIGSEQGISPVLASKVMVELVRMDEKLPGLWQPAPTLLEGLPLFKAATLPYGLSLSIEDQQAFFRMAGLLPVTGIPVDGLISAVNSCLAKRQSPGPVRLKLRAGVAGNLKLEFAPSAVTVVRKMDDPSDGVLRLSWQAIDRTIAKGRIELPKHAALTSLSVAAETELLPIRAWGATGNPAGKAQYCTPRDSLAQAFSLKQPATALVGLDIPLRLRSSQLAATVALYSDQGGRPGRDPYEGTVLPVVWPADASARDSQTWVELDFQHPIQIPDPILWVVLTIKEGEVFWPLHEDLGSKTRLEDRLSVAEACGCVYHKGESPWLPRGSSEGAAIWAMTRLRLQALSIDPDLRMAVTRGAAIETLTLNDEGRGRATTAQLETLNNDRSSLLEIRGDARCTGRIRLRDLRVAYRVEGE